MTDPDAQVQALQAALAGRTDLDHYGDNKRLLFAAQLVLGFEDVSTVAASALTDGRDDKAIDFLYVDREAGVVVLAQAYEVQAPGPRRTAKQTKAATLHQAVAWLFHTDLADLPPQIASAVNEVRSSLEDGVIQQFLIWFVHNLLGSDAVHDELREVERLVDSAIQSLYPESHVDVRSEELGRDQLAAWHRDTLHPNTA